MQQLYILDDGGCRGILKQILADVLAKQIEMTLLYRSKVRVTNTVNSLEVGSWRPSLGLALKVLI